jgi:Zn-dependent protease
VRPSPLFFGLLAITLAGGVLAVFENEFAYTTGTVLLVLGGWAVSLCLHEFGHAYVAYKGGDYEVRFKGYLNLDIRRYTDPVFSIVMPVLLLLIGGIPLPGGAVWINHHALRNKRIESWVSLAGPLSNLAIGALLTVSVAAFFDVSEYTLRPDPLPAALSYLAVLQIAAFVLNILPVPGLDGWGAIEPWLPYKARVFGAKARPWAPLVLFAVLIGSAFWDLAYLIFGAVGGLERPAAFGGLTFMFWR